MLSMHCIIAHTQTDISQETLAEKLHKTVTMIWACKDGWKKLVKKGHIRYYERSPGDEKTQVWLIEVKRAKAVWEVGLQEQQNS